MPQEFSFKLGWDDFDRSLLDNPPPAVGSDAFRSKITEFFGKQFIGFGGKARVVIDDNNRSVEVLWTKESQWNDPTAKALDLLNAGQIKQALPILATIHLQNPTDVDALYRLGIAYSELGRHQKAIEFLEKAIALAPDHVHALVGLGVAEIAVGNPMIAEELLSKAARIEPGNRWAWRNLAGALMKQRRFEESLSVIQQCLAVAPDDIAMMIALGDCLAELGRSDESQVHYRMAVRTGGPEHLVDLAKARLTGISQRALRSSGNVRPDVVGHMKDALGRFKSMEMSQIQSLALEIAVLGNKGIDINDPSKRYPIHTWPGEYSGLHLISIMYAAFQQFAPGTDVGIDLGKEYRIALGE